MATMFIIEIGGYPGGLLGIIWFAVSDISPRAKLFGIIYYLISVLLILPQFLPNAGANVVNVVGFVMQIFMLIFFVFKAQYLDNL